MSPYVERLRSMIARSGAEIAVGPPDMIHYLQEAAGAIKMIGTPEEFYALPHEGGELRPLASHEACYIQHSSGSTNKPKGVFVSQRAMLSNARGISRHGLKLRPGRSQHLLVAALSRHGAGRLLPDPDAQPDHYRLSGDQELCPAAVDLG